MSTLKNKLQHLIEGQIPEYLRETFRAVNSQAPGQFVDFIKLYYKFLDENRQVNNILLNSSKWTDVDLTLDLFVDEMRKQYAYDISPEALVEQRRLIKFINQYYESKGTENAAELFFRMMYNDTVTVKYPGDYILRASDGIWESKKTIKIDTDYTQIDPSSLALAPAALRTEASDVFSLKEKTIYLKYHRREATGLNLYSLEFGCESASRIITNQDIYKLEIDIPKATSIADVNTALSTLPYYDTVWVTAFENGVEYVYGFLTQQLIGYNILYGGENFRRRDTFTVEVSESALYPIPGQENNNGIVRVANTTSKDAEEYFATDYVITGSEYSVSDSFTGIVNSLRFISTGHRFDITGDYFAEAYDETNDYTTYKDFDRVFDNPRGNEYAQLTVGDYFEAYSGDARYMENNDETGYTDFNVDIYNITAARVRFQVGYIYEHPGVWKNNAGFLSDINKLQDNYYYQPYSYVVQTKHTPYETWNNLFKNSAHPAGFAVFGELLIEDDINFEPITIESTQYYIQNFIDGVHPIDSVTKIVEKPVSDTVYASQSYAPEYFAELYVGNETFAYDFNKVTESTVETVDNVALDVEPIFVDSVLTTEQTIKEFTLPNISDSIGFTENVESEITITRTFTESVNIIDDAIASNILFTVSDTATLLDEPAILLEKTNITDGITLSDSSVKNIDLVIDVLDEYSTGSYFDEDYVDSNRVSFVEDVIVSTVLLDDTVVTTDETALWVYRTASDSMEISDAISTLETTLNKSETVNTVDDITQVDTDIHFADSITVTDTAIRTFDQQNDATSDLAEDLSIADESVLTVSPVYTDSVALTDAPVVLDIDSVLSDAPVITETLARDVDTFLTDENGLFTDTIVVGVDDYVANGYVDVGYGGTVTENTDVSRILPP